jgi:hypothetical protein
MLKKLLFLLLFAFVLISINAYAETPTAYRSWTYIDLNAVFSPNWALQVLGSHSYEYDRNNVRPQSKNEPKGTFFYEFFIGPVYTKTFGPLTVKLPLWYYYQGFPYKNSDKYDFSHNIEFVPTVDYKIGPWKFWNRIIFHNKVYSDFDGPPNAAGVTPNFYDSPSDRKGYSLLVREYFRVEYSITPSFRLLLGDEIFYGLIEDKATVDKTPVPLSPGFEKKGWSQNRLYAGVGYNITPTLILTPMYMYQTQYFEILPNGAPEGTVDTTRKISEKDHYLFVVLTCVAKFYE